jgi:hypothetical protein
VLEVQRPSLLRFGGIVIDRPPDADLLQFADWLVLPAVYPVTRPRAVSRWQWWRLERDIWLPAPYLSQSPITIACERYAIVLRDSDSEIGQWMDWSDGLGETMFEGIPPRSGQAVRVSSRAIERFAQQSNMTFCWLCQLTSYYRERQSQEFASFAEQRIYGASYIVSP